MRRIVTWILVLALVGGGVYGIWWLRQRRREASAEVEVLRTGEVVRDTLEISVAASGNVSVERSVELSFENPGTVEAVNVEVGNRISEGQVLAVLDDETLVDAVRQAELELAQAELSLQQASTTATEAEIRLAELAIQEAVQAMRVAETSEELALVRASIDQSRAQDIEEQAREAYETYIDVLDDFGLPQAYAAGVTAAYMEAEGNVGITALRSEYAIEQAQNQYLAAYQRYKRATRDLELLEAGADELQLDQLALQVDQAQLALEQAEADLASAKLVAPFDGVVAAVNLQPGITAPTLALPAVTLLDDSRIFVDLTIDEIDIGAIGEGQTVALTLDAYAETPLEGTVKRIGVLPSMVGGVIAYPVRVQLEPADGVLIRDGMTASARVVVGQIQDAVLIPNWAIRTEQSTAEVFTYCYCLDSGEPVRTTLELGPSNETWTQVLSGVEAGATIALVSEDVDLLDFQGPPSRGRQ